MTNVVDSRSVMKLLLNLEVRGEKAGHAFHGNQFGHGGSGKPMTRKEAVAALREAGYTGPTSFSVPRLNEIHAAHVASQGHPPVAGAGVSASAPAPAPAAKPVKVPKATTQNVKTIISDTINEGKLPGTHLQVGEYGALGTQVTSTGGRVTVIVGKNAGQDPSVIPTHTRIMRDAVEAKGLQTHDVMILGKAKDNAFAVTDR